jgi:NADPH:quinone reductase-like Zn-dependent oxidoreductase
MPLSPTMHAVVMHERGGPDVLRYEEMPRPEPAAGEVLVRVRAASVNHTDLFHRSGHFVVQKPLPHVLGMDVAGEVASIGSGVVGWAEGDRVTATFEALGRERDGAYAEFTTVPAVYLHRIPDGLDFVGAVSAGLAFTTAWIALFDAGQLRDDDRVVIHAASSGVGTAALQIAHWRGAQVVAITDPGKGTRLRTLGAQAIVDRRSGDLARRVTEALAGQAATLVLDLVGRATLQESLAMIGRGGRIVCVGTLSGDLAEINVMDLIMKRGTIRGSFGVIRRDDYDTILELFAEGTFRPVVDSVLPLSQARDAHERVQAKQVFGKIVLVP